MVATDFGDAQALISPDYDREVEFRAFFDSKTGVKGLVDSGVEKVPQIFFHNFDNPEDKPVPGNSQLSIPVIDIGGINQDAALRSDVVDRIRSACENWGFFQVLNHGIPVSVMDKMIDTIRVFHEQDAEKKTPYCTSDPKQTFKYNNGTFDPSKLKRAATWHDSVSCGMDHLPPCLEDVPAEFRSPLLEYISFITTLGTTLFGLLSQALGLETNHLKQIGCADGIYFIAHYYPPCPEPELTLGASSHTDVAFLNMLLQDQTGGLQVLHKNEWVDVTPLPGALVVNLGDMLQLITSDKFSSVNHRVLAKKVGPRISMASFMRPMASEAVASQLFGPIRELFSEENPPVYKETTFKEYIAHHYSNLINGDVNPPLVHFKL